MLKRARLTLCLTASVLAASVATAQQTPTESATATIQADKPGPRMNRQVFGQFAEHLGHGIYDGIWVGEKSKIPNDHG
jgi:alpha-N-arabinofuranosidase